MRGKFADRLANIGNDADGNFTFFGVEHATYRLENGGLACTVAAKQRHDTAIADLKRDIAHCLNRMVIKDLQVGNAQHSFSRVALAAVWNEFMFVSAVPLQHSESWT